MKILDQLLRNMVFDICKVIEIETAILFCCYFILKIIMLNSFVQ
jgi:hypothetical protein